MPCRSPERIVLPSFDGEDLQPAAFGYPDDAPVPDKDLGIPGPVTATVSPCHDRLVGLCPGDLL